MVTFGRHLHPAKTSLNPNQTDRPADFSTNINGFRGVCVAMVFISHVANSRLPPAADPNSFWQPGLQDFFLSFAFGVELFFMISGFVIIGSLRRHASVPRFLFDRAMRIFPLWLPLGVCTCIACIALRRNGFEEASVQSWIVHALLSLSLVAPLVPVPMAHPATWSLTYEWMFYLASATAALLWRAEAALPVAKIVWAAAVVVLICLFPRALFFLPGVIVAAMPVLHDRLQRVPGFALPSLVVFLLAWWGAGILSTEFNSPLWAIVSSGHGPQVLVAFIAATYLFSCVAAKGGRMRILASSAAQQLGTISYSFYLMHPLVMGVVKPMVVKWLPNAHGSWVATLAFAVMSALLSWPISWACWFFAEQRFGRWIKARLQPTRTSSIEGVAAVSVAPRK